MRNIKCLLFTLCVLSLSMHGLLAEELSFQEITVQHGDTLWKVSQKYLKDPQRWPEILKHNKLNSSDPNVILPGMTLNVPVILIKEHLRSAELIALLNDVRYRRKSDVTFSRAELKMKLYNDDAVRTYKESHAKIKFYSGELLQIDENSFIVIRPEKKQEEVHLRAGAVRASRAKILSADTIIMPKVTAKSVKPDFKTRLKEDKTTLVEVYKGVVDVTAQGETVTLTKGFGTEVKFMKAPSPPKKLPPLPEMRSEMLPGTNITAQSKLSANQLNINLKTPAPEMQGYGKAKILGQLINKYHLQIATDNTFTTVVLDEIGLISDRVNIDFKKKNIPDGKYYYRISYIDQLGFEGPYTQSRSFITDQTPPALHIEKPVEGAIVEEDFIHVLGTTEPGNYVKINDRSITVGNDGIFQASLSSKQREVVLIIHAEDSSGNITKVTRSLVYTPGKITKKSGLFGITSNVFMGIISISVIVGVIALII